MKLSDYVASFLVQIGVKDVFLISGGGMMHLLDSAGKADGLNLIYNLNEQASSICADSYGQFTNRLGVCMVTTGPGGTNAITGVAASFLDSTPILVISGQCKTADFADIRGVRQFGSQEVDIVSIVKPITKYAVVVKDPNLIRFHLEKAIFYAQGGRKGPVWIDIPLDMQGAQIDPETLEGFDPGTEATLEELDDLRPAVSNVFTLLAEACRPAFLIGHGVVASGAREEFIQLARKLQIPVLSTWRAKDVLVQEDPLSFESPGSPAMRYSNYVLQNCDLLIIVGARLNFATTIYDERHFAYRAKKVIVDIDKNEIKKLDMEFAASICADAKTFIREAVLQAEVFTTHNWEGWLKFCSGLKQKYPLENETQDSDQKESTNPYKLAQIISEHSSSNDIYVGSSSGRTCGISHMAFALKEGQRFISSMGLGSMGFTVPSAISCCIASGKRRVIALEGDGSLQHNLQELQLIRTYELPIKLFILSNGGYASIYMMQRNNFKSHFAGCHPQSKVVFPSMEEIAHTYHLDYHRIDRDEQIEGVLAQVLLDDRPVLCEVMASIYFDEIPKSITVAHPDGTFSSAKLEELYPFLPKEEIAENMPEWGS